MSHSKFFESDAAWDPDLVTPEPASPPATPGTLPDKLKEKIAEYQAEDPKLQEALDELGTFIETHAGMQSQKDRFGSDLNLVKAQLQRAKDLLKEIDALDAHRTYIHDRIATIAPKPLPDDGHHRTHGRIAAVTDEERVAGFSDDGHGGANE